MRSVLVQESTFSLPLRKNFKKMQCEYITNDHQQTQSRGATNEHINGQLDFLKGKFLIYYMPWPYNEIISDGLWHVKKEQKQSPRVV